MNKTRMTDLDVLCSGVRQPERHDRTEAMDLYHQYQYTYHVSIWRILVSTSLIKALT